ncbi:MAG: hypothetical protein J5674_01695, partial [Candidatus Methanomethylophilaceae archaeon]|nr:hypothetical protein [Candidatus Methanomethylophilaceae archaeon]
MLPLWIINLGEDKESERRLATLLDGMSDAVKPFWHYLHPGSGEVSSPEEYRRFESRLVREGQQCYNGFMDAGLRVSNFQIVVLGAADEALSQSVFAPLAGILRDALPRIVADHTKLGVEITGLLYIPSTANQDKDDGRRQRMAVFLEEVNLLSGTGCAGAYNRVIGYQDIQHQSVRFYERLDAEGRAALLFQYLVHLFLGSHDGEKLSDRIGADGGVYALGAASAYFSSKAHREAEMKTLLERLTAEFKDMENADVVYADKSVRKYLDTAPVFPEDYSSRLSEGCASIDVDLSRLEDKADPHPVWDLLKVDLFPSYYRKYLRYMPARLVRFMQELSYALLSRYAGRIRANVRDAEAAGRLLLRGTAAKILADKENPRATIAQLELFFAKARGRFEELRSDPALPYRDILPVPRYLKNDYERFSKDGGDGNSEADILDKLKKNLRQEPVTLALLVRCFFLGVILLLVAVPLAEFFFPSAMAWTWLWIPALFLLPLAVELVFNVRRHFKRIRRLKYGLLAATLLSVNRKLFHELNTGIEAVYAALVSECEEQVKALSALRDALEVPETVDKERLLPKTRFNQPLFEGCFKGESMVTGTLSDETRLSLPGGEKSLSALVKEDYLRVLKLLFQELPLQTDLGASEADKLVEAFREKLSGRLRTMDDSDILTVLARLAKRADLTPLRKMAALNGMLFSVDSGNAPVVKATEDVPGIEGASVIKDDILTDYVMVTTWQKLSPGI